MSQIDASQKEALEMFSAANMKQSMAAVVDRWAGWAQTHHAYIDRTGSATRYTVGRIGQAQSGYVSAEMAMDVDYASYLSARGLTQFESAVSQAGDRFTTLFESMSARLNGKK